MVKKSCCCIKSRKRAVNKANMLDHDVGGLSKSDALFLPFGVSLFRL